MVIRTERGWPGHYICGYRCLFRRNTLLTCGDTKVVVSTVGLQLKGFNKIGFEQIGIDRNFETMAFHSDEGDKKWNDPDVSRPFEFESNWRIEEEDADVRANDMHEAVVLEITNKLKDE